MPKNAVFTLKLEPALRDAFMAAAEVQARFATRRTALLAKAGHAGP